jgi:hypothetical protein
MHSFMGDNCATLLGAIFGRTRNKERRCAFARLTLTTFVSPGENWHFENFETHAVV